MLVKAEPNVIKYLGCALKIIISLGFVLHDTTGTQDFRYFYPADNNPVSKLPLTLLIEDLDKMENIIKQKDVFE